MEINKSLIIPLKEEGIEVIEILANFLEHLKNDTELLVVIDSIEDKTHEILENSELDIKVIINNLGPGVSNAINSAISECKGRHICIAMGDGSDDPRQVEDLLILIQRGLSVAVASRYSRGGQFVGNKNLKYILSKYSGFFLNLFLGLEQKIQQICSKLMIKTFLTK